MGKKRKKAVRDNEGDLVYSTGPDGPLAHGRGATFLPETGIAAHRDLPPSEQTLEIKLSSRGRRGKTATEISGFRLTEASLKELGKELKQHCGSGGRVEGSSILLQGDQVASASQFLADRGFAVRS